MSRAGVRARRARLVAAGSWVPADQWTPTRFIEDQAAEDAAAREQERREAMLAERDWWIREHGTAGWQREQARRRAERNARLRRQRRARETTTSARRAS